MEWDKKNIALIVIVVIMVVAIGAFAYISMNSTSTKIEINCNETMKNGDYITVLLKDDYRNAIPDQTIDLKILDDSGWAHKYNVTTDELGRGYIQLVAFDNGNYTVHANYNGTLFFKESHNNLAFEIDDGYYW